MSGKGIIPIAAAGVAAYFLMDSFTKKKTKPAKKKEEDPNVVASGDIPDSGGWSWRVLKGKAGATTPEGFGGAGSAVYYGFVREPKDTAWKSVHMKGVSSITAAKNLALEFVANVLENAAGA